MSSLFRRRKDPDLEWGRIVLNIYGLWYLRVYTPLFLRLCFGIPIDEAHDGFRGGTVHECFSR